jgi:PAS domain S-box-containing protein
MLAETHVASPGQVPEFEAAFRTLPMPALIIDPRQADNPVVFVNDAFVRVMGYSGNEILGRSWRLLRGPATDPESLEAIDTALHLGETLEIEVLSYGKAGRSFWSSIVVSPVQDEAGCLRWCTLLLSDASARRQAERERIDMEQHLEDQVERRTQDLQSALEQKTALLHEVEHRVKNSLQMTASIVLLKARRLQNPEARKVLQEIAERVGALATAHRLLYAAGDVSRFNLKDFTVELAGELIMALPKGQVDLNLSIQPLGVPASKAAPLALLLNEVIGNAVKHAFPNDRHGRLAIEIGRAENGLKIAVEDNGVGLDHLPPPEGSFGKTLIAMLVQQLKGQLIWHDMKPGTRAEIVMPVDAEEMQFE